MTKFKNWILLISCVLSMVALFVGCTPPDYQLSSSIVPATGGTISPSTGTFKGGSKVTLVANPSQYYKFIGWAGDVSGVTNPLTINMNSNKQIVAQFSKITYNIETKSTPSDGGIVRPGSGQYEAGTTITATATPNAGYRFVNWGTDASGSNNSVSVLVSNNKTVTANFVKQYKLTVSADPNSGTVNSNGGIYDAGASVDLTATPIFPWAFKNWVGADNNNTNPTKVTINADTDVSATFVQLIKKLPVQKSGDIYSGNINIPIDLNQFEWIEGYVNRGPFDHPAYVLDPSGKNIEDLGSKGQANFQIRALISGKYTIVIERNFMYQGAYDVNYTVYGLK